VQDRSLAQDLVPTRAIIDIGSNTVRLVVYGGPVRAPTVLHNEKVTARLGKGVAETGRLAPKAADAALAALARYRALLDLQAVPAIDVVATAAVRDAADGPEFLARVAALGFSPRLLTGVEEAWTGALGVIGAFPGARGVVADLGGGSLELIDIDGEVTSFPVSLPLGTLRLPPLREKGDRAFARTVRGLIEASGWNAPANGTLYLVGGSLRALARVALEQVQWPTDDSHGFALPAPIAADVARKVLAARPEVLAAVPGISASRLASLPDAAALLLALIEVTGAGQIVFSAWGLREGLLYQSLTPAQRGQDPMLAGMAAHAGRHGVTLAGATMIAGWTARINSPAARQPGYPGDENLRLCTALLARSIATLEPNLRPDAARSWSLRKRWIGISNRQRAMLAATLLANAGLPDLPTELLPLADEADLREALAWGLAVRLCRRFTGGAPAALAASALAPVGNALVLAVREPFAALVNDAAQRDLKALAAALGLKARVRVLGEDEDLP